MGTKAEENAALVRRFFTDVVDAGDVDAGEVFVTEDVVDHGLGIGADPESGPMPASCWRVLAAADVDVSVHDVIATDDRVAVRGRVSGTPRPSVVDLAPTGESFDIACAWFCRVEEGSIAEIWSLPDGLGLLRQLEVIPPVRESDD